MEDRMSLKERYGPWAVIAGASEGTGSAFARKLAREGVPSVLIARRLAPLKALADEIRAETGVECATATVDLSALDAAERLAAAVGDRDVGLFIFNAGSDTNGALFLDRDIAAWDELVQRNVMTTMRAAHHFGAAMRKRGKGGLMLVNSGACYGGLPSISAYAASKAFVLTFAEGLWAELKGAGVDVLTLVLGRTDTPAFRTLLAEKGLPIPADLASPDDVAEAGLARLPHGPIHNFGYADEVAGPGLPAAAGRRERILSLLGAMRESTGGGER
jgi:short-subunit dehydrogenase